MLDLSLCEEIPIHLKFTVRVGRASPSVLLMNESALNSGYLNACRIYVVSGRAVEVQRHAQANLLPCTLLKSLFLANACSSA